MSETQIIIEETDSPLVVEVFEESVEVVSTPVEEKTIEILAGSRGVTTQWILGALPPLPTDGSLGDVYLVTQGINAGDVYKKLPDGTWSPNGSIRGAGHGVTEVNGDVGPVVVLTKDEIGLANVDDTSDANKPVSTATQTALDLKANDADVVHDTGAETIAGVKTFSSAPVVPDSSFAISKTTNLQTSLDGKVSLTGNQTISDTKTFSKTPLITPETGMMLPTQMTAHNMHMFHDRFRFTTPVFQTSADGSSWNAPATTGHNALDGRSDTSLAIDNANRYVRWYWDNTNDIAFGNIVRLIARWGYTAINPDVIVTVESSANGTAWTTRGTTTMTPASTQQFTMSLNDHGGDTYYRVTMQVTGGAGSGTVAVLHMLEVQTYRHGSQGRGFEIETPFWWNAQREIGLYNHLRPQSAGVYDIGLTGTRFRDAYFSGTVNSGTFAGSGASLTALNGSNISTGTVPDARLSSNVALLTGTQTITGDKTFTGAVIVPTPTLSTHAATKGYIDAIVDAAPGTLDTLNELAAALGDDANFSTTVTNSIATKEPIITAGTTAQYWRGDKTWQTLNSVTVDLTTNQTIAGTKTFSGTDTYMVRSRATTGNTVTSRSDITLGGNAGDRVNVRIHENAGQMNTFKLVDMIHRRAAGTDWTTAQWYEGVGVDTSYLDSPTTGASKLKTWIMRDPNTNTMSVGSEGNIFLTLTNTAITVGASAVFTGNGSGLTTLNGTNISSGTVADARLSSNVVLLTGTQTLTGAKTFSALITGSAGATITGTVTATAFSGDGAAITALNGTSIATGTVAIPRLPAGVVYRVVHDGVNWPARPTGATYVEWVGPTVPSAATANDTWVNTSV